MRTLEFAPVHFGNPLMRISLFAAKLLLGLVLMFWLSPDVQADRPNVIVIMSDDQGGGDYGFMGNDVIRTPSLDAMAKRGGVLSRFYVSNVCAPTRASLMTGRFNYRTRCIDTYVGRAMMDGAEVTIAEYLRDAGYNTGIYGKWHLGDNYPLRAMDQGFQDSLVHRGGGIGQPSDPIGAEGKYTDPTLIKNGVETPMRGYCTDIYFDAAIDFISKSVTSKTPFFSYIATNAPHGPFHDVPKSLYEEYKQVDFRPILINKKIPERRYTSEADKLARIAAMITNIDENVGRLFSELTKLGIAENTIVMYLNDNGPNSMRYVGNMRGMKTHVDDGGIRSPLIVHWPAKIQAGTQSNGLSAHIDILPSILDACGVQATKNKLDGRSFLPLLTGQAKDLPERTLVLQSHRGNVPTRFHHFALHRGWWKLVHPTGFGAESFPGTAKLQLYDLSKDPQQQNDLAEAKPNKLAELKRAYEAWFEDVSGTRADNFAPPRIVIGTYSEPVTVLTRQDWRHASGRPWGADSNGFWLLEVPEPTMFQLEIVFRNDDHPEGKALVTAGTLRAEAPIAAKQQRRHFVTLSLPAGKLKLSVDVTFDDKTVGPHQLILTRK